MVKRITVNNGWTQISSTFCNYLSISISIFSSHLLTSGFQEISINSSIYPFPHFRVSKTRKFRFRVFGRCRLDRSKLLSKCICNFSAVLGNNYCRSVYARATSIISYGPCNKINMISPVFNFVFPDKYLTPSRTMNLYG